MFDKEWINQLCSGVEIPTAFYKIIIRENNGKPDILAVIFSQDTQPGTAIRRHVNTVGEIEEFTGIDLLSNLPVELENSIESEKAEAGYWQLGTILDTRFRSRQRELCVLDPVKRSEYYSDQLPCL